MRKFYFLLLTLVTMALNANASIKVCGVEPDENGHFNSSFIKSGSIIWDNDSRTLTMDNAVVEYNTENRYDNVYPLHVNEDATIVIHGDCKLTTNGFVALRLNGMDNSVTIKGDGSLSLSSTWIDLHISYMRVTIKDITLKTTREIGDNNIGDDIVLTFDNVSADILGGVERIGAGITLNNCSITEPEGGYVEHEAYGYFIAEANGNHANHVVISRDGNKPGDVNCDGDVTIADGVAVLNAMAGQSVPGNPDINGDNDITIADFVAVLNIMAGQ